MIERLSSSLCQAAGACAALAAVVSMSAASGRPVQCDIGRTSSLSAPKILEDLAPAWVAAFARAGGGTLDLKPPFGPPQGALDARLGDVLDGRRDLALLTREIAEADLTRWRAHHGGRAPAIVPVASGGWNRFGQVDAVAIVVHRSNPIRRLSFRQIDAVFSTTLWRGGRPAVTWGDLGLAGAWRARPIRLIGSGGWTGEESARALTIRRHVLSVGEQRGQWRPAPDGGSEADVVARVGADPAAVGFTGMGHLSRAVRAVPIAVAGGPAITPTEASARNGHYPLLRTVDLLIDPADRGATGWRFARFLLSPVGQALIAPHSRLQPLPPGDLERARRLVGRHGCPA